MLILIRFFNGVPVQWPEMRHIFFVASRQGQAYARIISIVQIKSCHEGSLSFIFCCHNWMFDIGPKKSSEGLLLNKSSYG